MCWGQGWNDRWLVMLWIRLVIGGLMVRSHSTQWHQSVVWWANRCTADGRRWHTCPLMMPRWPDPPGRNVFVSGALWNDIGMAIVRSLHGRQSMRWRWRIGRNGSKYYPTQGNNIAHHVTEDAAANEWMRSWWRRSPTPPGRLAAPGAGWQPATRPMCATFSGWSSECLWPRWWAPPPPVPMRTHPTSHKWSRGGPGSTLPLHSSWMSCRTVLVRWHLWVRLLMNTTTQH